MGKKNLTPRGIAPEDNQSQTAQQNPADNTQSSTTGNANDQTQSSTFFKKPKREHLVKFVVSIVLTWGLYALFSGILERKGVNFFLSHLIGCILALMLLNYFDSIFESPVKIAKPVLLLMTLLFCYDLSVKYLPGYGKAEKNNSKIELSSETGTLRSVGEVWFTDNIFKAGSNVEIKVSYQSIQMVGGKLYTPGVYKYIPPGDGKIIFKGIIDAPSNVKVSY